MEHVVIAGKDYLGEDWWYYCWRCHYVFGPGESVLTIGESKENKDLYCPRHWFIKNLLDYGTLKYFQETYNLIEKAS